MFPAKCLARKRETRAGFMCCPATKQLITAVLMNNRGKILAVDISEKDLKP
jgi:hypothetical protein